MSSPYINTKLYTTVTIVPNQMNNDIYSHMKSNLVRRLEGRCYRNYGFISKVFEILERGEGVMEPENPLGSALYNVKFSCRLCMPLKDKHIICKVERTIPMLTSLSNGPIRVLITNDRINKESFVIGKTGILVKNKLETRPLQSGDIVKVRIDSRKFNNRDNIIMCMGVLEGIATEEQVQQFTSDEFNSGEKFVDYEKYIDLESQTTEDIGEEAEDEGAGASGSASGSSSGSASGPTSGPTSGSVSGLPAPNAPRGPKDSTARGARK